MVYKPMFPMTNEKTNRVVLKMFQDWYKHRTGVKTPTKKEQKLTKQFLVRHYYSQMLGEYTTHLINGIEPQSRYVEA
jgi:hypothetical protein